MDRRLLALLIALLLGLPGAHAAQFSASQVTVFASPDGSYGPLAEFIHGAGESLYLHAYTFESPAIAGELVRAKGRGVEVVVSVDKAPVGGISREEKAVIGSLLRAGVPVYYSGPNGTRFNHAKYAVADNRTVLVTTENMGPDGFPQEGTGNRGWGAVLTSPGAGGYFADLFQRDLGARKLALGDAGPEVQRPRGRYRPSFAPEVFLGNYSLETLVAPDDAVNVTLALLRSANRSIYIEQFYIYKYWGPKRGGSVGSTPNLFLEEAIGAARRGVDVRILMDSTWYNVELEDPQSNRHTLDYINGIGRGENLRLEARLVDLKSMGVEKVHTKGAIVDGGAVLVSSVNWNEHSPTKNREVGVIIYGAPAEYYTKVFLCDWDGGCGIKVPWLLVLLALLVLAIAILHRRRVR